MTSDLWKRWFDDRIRLFPRLGNASVTAKSVVKPEIQWPATVRQWLLHYGLPFAPLFVLLAYHSYVYNWLCDDAFISFRYVHNFVHGHGLVFNRGEHVEG